MSDGIRPGTGAGKVTREGAAASSKDSPAVKIPRRRPAARPRTPGQSAPVVPDAAVLLLEGVWLPGIQHGRCAAREIAVAFPDGTALSWRVQPQSRWRDRATSLAPVSPFDLPETVVHALDARLAGLRVLAPGDGSTQKYLKGLYVAAGCPVSLHVEDFDGFLAGEGVWPALRLSIEWTIASNAETAGTRRGAQVAASSMQDAVRVGRQFGKSAPNLQTENEQEVRGRSGP